MASSSAGRAGGAAGRIRNSVSTTLSDNHSLLADIRKSIGLIKDLAVDFEKQNQFHKVKELEDAVVKLLNASEDCQNFSVAAHSVGQNYQPNQEQELTDFKKLLDDEMSKAKADSTSNLQDHSMLRQFKETIWNVHHAGEPMPGEEQEDIVMTSTQCPLLNTTCPLSGKPVTELSHPVRSKECKHIYDKEAIMRYIKSKNSRGQCPVAACPKILQPSSVVCDPLLLIEIEEKRAMSRQTATAEVIEDFTELDEREDD